ncbi:MAG TPA: dodecin family protein [Alphaproteobacteria bacterium]|jgi:flavin-binding protein dodecin|nr:dodecin family protein [Alphaproteobacteria bacterium]
MSVARTTEITATSPKGFDDAVNQGIARAASTLRNIEGAWVKDLGVEMRDGKISEYKVHMKVTFVLDQ